jgi:hypothetical protein
LCSSAKTITEREGEDTQDDDQTAEQLGEERDLA